MESAMISEVVEKQRLFFQDRYYEGCGEPQVAVEAAFIASYKKRKASSWMPRRRIWPNPSLRLTQVI